MLKKLRSSKGFTLVEVMIVLVIMAILAAVGISAYSGYTQMALEKQIRSECLGIYSAAQAALDEYCTFHEGSFTEYVSSNSTELWEKDGSSYYDLGQGSGTNRGRLGRINEMNFQRLQGNMGNTPAPAEEQSVDNYAAQRILEYLESDSSVEEAQRRYVFGVYTKNYFGKKGTHKNITQYLAETDTKTQAVVNVYYNIYGNVFLVEWGHDGILCTITADGVTLEEDGMPYQSSN